MVITKMLKHMLQMRRLAFKVAARGAGRDGEGHAVRCEVRDEPRGAR
jgi:hypothetical protein